MITRIYYLIATFIWFALFVLYVAGVYEPSRLMVALLFLLVTLSLFNDFLSSIK